MHDIGTHQIIQDFNSYGHLDVNQSCLLHKTHKVPIIHV